MAQFLQFFQVILFAFISSQSLVEADQILYSPQISNWGNWGTFENCSTGTYVKGFQLKSETWSGLVDDTCMNGLRLYCGDVVDNKIITSSEGSWGKWRNIYTCGDGGYVTGFQLRVERPSLIPKDETATNNIRIFCSNRTPGSYLQGDGENFGIWSEERICGANEAVCGLQTQVQPDRGVLLDDTALNNIAVKCCDIPTCRKRKTKVFKNVN